MERKKENDEEKYRKRWYIFEFRTRGYLGISKVQRALIYADRIEQACAHFKRNHDYYIVDDIYRISSTDYGNYIHSLNHEKWGE